MAIRIAQLEEQLVAMSAKGAPGRDFCASIAELARTDRFSQLRQVRPAIVYDELWERYRQDPAAFIAGWRRLALDMQQGFIQHARQRLTSLTRLQQGRQLGFGARLAGDPARPGWPAERSSACRIRSGASGVG